MHLEQHHDRRVAEYAAPVEPPRFLDTPPFHYARYYAALHGCDLAVPSHIGIGSLVCYTRLVEAVARERGRPLRILTGPLVYSWKVRPAEEEAYPVWRHNPYVSEIVDADAIDPQIMLRVSAEMDNFCQSGHEIENICRPFGLRPRAMHGQLFLSAEEQARALALVAHLRRPLICICPYGRSSPPSSSPWYLERWLELIEIFGDRAGFVAVGNNELETKDLPIMAPSTSIREMMAIIWASDVYLGFDTGPSHIAAALGTRAAILWDAVHKAPLEEAKQPGFSIATMHRWTYPSVRNIMILGERDREVLNDCAAFIEEAIAGFSVPRRFV